MTLVLLKIIFFIFLGIFLYYICFAPLKEKFTQYDSNKDRRLGNDILEEPPNVILIGNIFSEHEHRQYNSIKEELLKNEKNNLGHVCSIDNECLSLKDFKKSVNALRRNNGNSCNPSIKDPVKHLDTKNTYAFISVGFYDIVKNVNNCNTGIQVKGAEKCMTESEIYKEWKEEIDYFRKKFPSVNIIIMSAYYLPDGEKLNTNVDKITPCQLKTNEDNSLLSKHIKYWNHDLEEYCKSHDLGFINMGDKFSITDIIKGSVDLNNESKTRLVKIMKQYIH